MNNTTNNNKKATVYNPKDIEEKFYNIWEDRGYFEIDGNKNIQKADKNFCIMMPPPNVTGSLHIGHALTFTLHCNSKCCRKTTLKRGENKRRNWKR